MKFNKSLLFLTLASVVFTGCSNNEKSQFTTEDIAINVSSLTLELNSTQYLNVANEKLNDFVTWTVADESVASINSNGMVTGLKAGTTTIDATYKDLKSTVNIEVIEPSAIPFISFDCDNEINMFEGQVFTFTSSLYFKGEKIEYSSFDYETDNASVVDVNNGVIVAKNSGVGHISVSTTYLNKFVANEITVNVVKPESSIVATNLSTEDGAYTLELDNGTSFTVDVFVIENGCAIEDPEIIWSTENNAVCSVTDGLIEGLCVGETTVHANYKNIVDLAIAVSVK